MRSKAKRSSSTRREEREETVPRFSSANDGWLELDTSCPGTASSSQGPSVTAVARETRVLDEKRDGDEMPEKSQEISNVCIGYGASDKTGGVPCPREHEEDLTNLAEEYQMRNDAGECFVHVRKNHSNNCDLRALSELTRGEVFTRKTCKVRRPSQS